MQFQDVKKDDIDKLPFVRNSVINNGTLNSLEIIVGGKIYLVTGTYGITLAEQKPDEIVERWVVSGKIDDIEIKPKMFDTEREAKYFIERDSSLEVVVKNFNKTKNYFTSEPVLRATNNDDEFPF